MAYIIENANILKNKQLFHASLLIENRQIAAVRPTFKKHLFIKMDADPYIMTPTHVLLQPSLPMDESFSTFKSYFKEHMIKSGCTTFLTYAEVEKEQQLEASIKRLKMQLINSPIDFIIGVKIPLRLLTPSLVRKTKRLKIPVLFVHMDDNEELHTHPWGWIREAMFPYNSPIAPIFSKNEVEQQKTLRRQWQALIKNEKIPAFSDELKANQPLSPSELRKIGIFPLKSNLDQGGEVSYNLYLKDRAIRNIDESHLFHYHKEELVITVHKGVVIRFGKKVLFRPGVGEQVIIKTPAYFY